MFDLEKAIAGWKKSMAAQPALEPGFIAEIEGHLRDKIEDLVAAGQAPEEAFRKSVEALGESGVVGGDFCKVYSTRRSGRPASLPPRFIPGLAWSYVRTAMRFLRKHKGFAVLNIAGLTVGMLAFLLIMTWVRNELSYDQFHEKKDRLFMILSRSGDGPTWSSTTYALPPALKADYPEVEDYARVWPWHHSLVRYGGVRFEEKAITLTDPGFFRMFSFPFVKGNPETALADKNSLVLTEKAARRYFGEEDPLGKTLNLATPGADFTVTGVVRDIPLNSSLQFDMVSRVEWLGEQRLARWTEYVAYAYVQLRPGVSAESFNPKISGILKAQVGPNWRDVPLLQPFTKAYLYEDGRPGIIIKVYLFSGIAVLILLIACINFMNLSTVQSSQRAGEVGLRKTLGAGRAQIARQFLAEAVFLSAVSMILALGIAPMVMPWFHRLAGTNMGLFGPEPGGLIVILVLAAAAVGLLAGSYPALLLSAFRPVETLRNRIAATPGGSAFRKVLIVFQFAASVILILGSIVVARQLRFIRNFDLGFNRNQVISIENNSQILPKMDTFKQDLAGQPGILNVTFAAQKPLSVGQSIRVNWEGNPDPLPAPVGYTVVDYDFIETFEMTIVRGRSFSRQYASDETESCIINESAAKMFGWEDPVGRELLWAQGAIDPSLQKVRIIGVVKDFYDRSLRAGIRPFMFRIYRPWHQFIFIKIAGQKIAEALSRIRASFEKFAPDYSFRFEFLDEAFNRQYASESQQGRLFNVFGLLSIFVSSLGLYGLAAFTAERKTKEIGIRKVLGASVSSLAAMMTREYLIWVVVANLIAWPAGYFFMTKWLSGFTSRIPLRFAYFLISLGIVFLVVVIAVGTRTLRAARSNPVDSLRYE